MANIGKAYVNVVPKFPGLSASVQAEFDKIKARESGEGAGQRYGKGMGSGLAKSGAVVGAFAAVTNKALDAIGSHVGDATKRFDTLNNYPRVMESLGYGADAAEASISKMSDRLQSLPTTLDSMVSLTQGLVVNTKDLGKATDAALALNDMLLASGSSQQLVNSAQEQFRQILSKGKPDMQDWKSLTMAMPGQLDQLAKSMLGPTATATDLYAALGGGGAEATISMQQLLDEIIRLDAEGGAGFDSFQKQAETAAGGVQTSAANMGNAITRGITGVMDAIGKENIAGMFNDMKGGINSFFSVVQSGVSASMPAVKGVLAVVKEIGPSLVAGGAGYAAFSKGASLASSAADVLKARWKDAAKAAGEGASRMTVLGNAASSLVSPMGIASVAIGATAAVAMYCASAWQKSAEEQQNMTKATIGLNDAVSKASALDEYKGKVSGIGEASSFSAMSVSELAESMAKHVDKMNEATSKAEEQVSALDAAKSVINQYAGQSDLSAQAQGQLEYALKTVNEQLGLNLTATDVMNNSYTDANGSVQNLTQSVNGLIEAKRREIQMDALSESLAEAYKAKSEAADTYAAAIKKHADNMKSIEAAYASGETTLDDYNASVAMNNAQLDEAKGIYDGAAGAVDRLNEEMGDAAKSASDAADSYDDWGTKAGDVFAALLQASGTTLPMLKDDLRSLGADTEKLGELSSEQLQQLASTYDGTTSSIVGLLAGWGVGMSSVSEETLAMASTITEALNSMDVATPLQAAGVNVDDFALQLANAGVSTETLNQVGSENLAALAQSCGGNVGLMIGHLQMYNATPLYDKDGSVSVNDVTLTDALGQIYTWNGQQLLNKDGSAVVNQVQLEDAQGNLVTWNGTELQDKDGKALVRGNMARSISTRNAWNNGDLFDKECTATINIVRNISTNTMNAAGGYRMNAAGGVRYHADGFIATRAMALPPVDIAGEAGAEAIVPLTNRKYAQPFVDMIAEGVREQTKAGESDALLRRICGILMAIYEVIPEREGDFEFANRVRSAMSYGAA